MNPDSRSSRSSSSAAGQAFPPRRRNVAVVLAGGVGSRMGLDIPKQFVPVAGKTSLEHSVEVFQSCDCIDDILVMMEAGFIARARELLPLQRFSKIIGIAAGGVDRSETSYLAIQRIGDPGANVLFHDAVRPLLDVEIIRSCIQALDVYSAVDTAIPSSDTIIEVDEHNFIRSVPPRAKLRRGQTPQAFRLPVIKAAYELARKDPGFAATDDCSVVLKYLPEVPIFVVPGDESNIKITLPIDIHLADKLFQLKRRNSGASSAAVGLGGSTVVVFGGSSGIGAELVRQLESEGACVVSHSRTVSGTFVEDRQCVAAALAAAAAAHGKVDHVVLTAGVLTVGPLVGMTDEQLHHDVDVNLMAAFIVAQESYRYLAETGGSLTLYASSSYTRGRANFTVYSATKAAVVNLTQALADEWAGSVRVNCISPSRTATPMRSRAFGVEAEETLLQAATVSAATVRVIGSEMTGQVIDVRLPKTDPLNESAPAGTMSHTIQADSRALSVTGPAIPPDCTLSVLLANRRIWTFRASEAGASGTQEHLSILWPAALSARFSGSAELSLLGDGVLIGGPCKVVFDDTPGEFTLEEPVTATPQVINKWGRIARSFEDGGADLVDEVLAETERLIRLVRKRCGMELFVTGGTLLGPVRDGRIMPGDDDADLAYMSLSENPSDIALESYRLERILASEGYETVRHSTGHLQLMFPGNSLTDRFYIDIFTYFTLGDWFYGPFHAREPARDVTVFPLQTLNVNGRELPAPANPEQMLAAIYGPGWRTPDPAFRFITPPPARRRFQGWLNSFDSDRENWEDHHRTEIAAGREASPSAWAQRLAAELAPESRILELGCGLGADARYLADRGHHVLAVDYSRPALQAAGTGTPHRRLAFRRTNLASVREAAALAGAVSVTGTPLHVYARLLLNALNPEGQDCTLTLIRHLLRAHGGSGRAFLEIDPGPTPWTYSGWSNYRPLDPARLRQELQDKGLEIEDSAADSGSAQDGHHHLQLSVKARTP